MAGDPVRRSFYFFALFTGSDAYIHIIRTGRLNNGMKLHERTKIPFMSPCPRCAQVRLQRGYDRASLLRLFNGGYPVEAYCDTCDEFWSVSGKERAALVAAAISGGGSIVC